MERKEITWKVEDNGCWRCTSHATNNVGYAVYWQDGRLQGMHRIIWERHHKKRIPLTKVIMHTCDNRYCINPDHLVLGSQEDNLHDMANKGRSAKGEQHSQNKLTEEQVLEIFKDKRYAKIIAPEYGIHKSLVDMIRRGERWGWLTNAVHI